MAGGGQANARVSCFLVRRLKGWIMRFPFFLRRLVVSVLLTCATAALAEGEAQWKTPDGLVDAFVELALKSEYSRRDNPVRKWSAPIRYHIVHRVGEQAVHEQLVRTHLRHLAQLTGLSIEPAETAATANFIVVLTNDARIEVDVLAFAGADRDGRREQFFRDSMCLASFRADRTGNIQRAVGLIPVDRARGKGELVACIAEELTHMVGLSNDTDRPLPSIFNHGTVRSFLSGLDVLMLKMLYDPRIRPGMKEAAARPLLLRIAGEYEAAGTIGHAERMAAEGGLAGASP